MLRPNKKKQVGGTDTMANGIPKKYLVDLNERIIPQTSTLKEIPTGSIHSEDTRSFFNDSRAKERGDEFWNVVKKGSALAQYAPIPLVRYPAMAINSAMGMVDTYESFKKGDNTNGMLNAIGAVPLPGSDKIKNLGSGFGRKIAAKAARAAMVASGVDLLGTTADLTNNFGKEKKKGGLSKMGYRDDSPYRNRESIPISTPEGLIDMSSTGVPLYAQDETGYSKVLPPYSGMHKFPGKTVTEHRMFQRGGQSPEQIYKYLFDDDGEASDDKPATAPSEEEMQSLPQQDTGWGEGGEEDYQSIIDSSMSMMNEVDDPFFQQKQYQTAPHGIEEANTGFRTFASPEAGRAALEHQLELYQTGETRNNVSPSSSIAEAMAVYAPASDHNDPVGYASFVAKKLGVSPFTPISQISTKKWADAITQMEGNTKGNNPGNLRPIR